MAAASLRGICERRRFESGRKQGAIIPAHEQIAGVDMTSDKNLLAMQKKGALRIARDEVAKFLPQEFLANHTKHFCRGKIGFENHSLVVQGQVADRREIVEVAETIACLGQVNLCLAQLLVLRLQLDLMQLQ